VTAAAVGRPSARKPSEERLRWGLVLPGSNAERRSSSARGAPLRRSAGAEQG
jgi:hypothetical protein